MFFRNVGKIYQTTPCHIPEGSNLRKLVYFSIAIAVHHHTFVLRYLVLILNIYAI
jgi:hypothetical protein